MKKSKPSLFRKQKSSGRYGLEAAILCILLLVAAYVGSADRPSTRSSKSTQPPAASIQKKEAEKKISSPSREQSNTPKTSAPAKNGDIGKRYTLAHLSDGDSFELKDENGRKIKIRLYGIDAPELAQDFGNDSKEHLFSLMRGRDLCVKPVYQDDYGRTVALVYLIENKKADELSINQRQVQAGMAWVYDHFCRNDICGTWKIEEAMARKQRLGLWKSSNPTPPWKWRLSHKR